MRKIIFTLSALALTACGGLNGKAGKSASSSALASVPGTGNPASILSFQPATSNVTSVPTSVVVNFSSSSIDQASATLISNYTISCNGGNPFQAQSVSLVPGQSSVNVVLPTITGLGTGSSCSFNVSANLRDSFANFVTGDHAATYTLSSNVSGSTGAWAEAVSATATAAVGSPVAASFMGIGADGMALQGLQLNGGQYVDGIGGVWAAFGATSLSYGQTHGASAGGFTQLSCPSGYRITGVFGRAGAYIDAIGITCKTEDQSQTYTSSVFGGAGGNAFTLSCPAGQFATDLNGRAGSYLDQLYLGCR